jgi:hypothetical protein
MCDFHLPDGKLGNERGNTANNLHHNIAGKLVAWLDGELPDHEAVLIERHVRACAECRGRVDAYERVGKAFNAYCDAALTLEAIQNPIQHPTASKPPKKAQPALNQPLNRWVPVLAAAAAVVAALFLAFPRMRPIMSRLTNIDQPVAHPEGAAASPAAASSGSSESLIASTPAPVPAPVTPLVIPAKTVRKPHATRPTQTPTQTRDPAPAPARAPRPSQILDAGWVPASPAIRIAIPAEAMFPPGAVPEGVNFTADFSIAADGSAAPLRLLPRPSGTQIGAPIGTQVHYERKPKQP